MPLVSSVDYINKRIYLSVSTVDQDVDTLDIYKEVRALRVVNEDHRKYKPMIIAGGNVTKITGVSATPIFIQLLYGCRIVPYNVGDHQIRLVRDTFTDDGFAGVDVFDRTSLSNMVDIDVDFPEVEIRYVYSGGGSPVDLTEVITKLNQTLEKVTDIHKVGGLDINYPATTTLTDIRVDDIIIELSGDGRTETTLTRTQ